IGFIVGFVTAPGTSKGSANYAGTDVLIVDPQNTQQINLQQAALLATTGDVPDRVAKRLGMSSADDVRDKVTSVGDKDLLTVKITAKSSNPDEATRLADASADELVADLSDRDQAAFQASVATALAKVDDLQNRINDIDAKIPP